MTEAQRRQFGGVVREYYRVHGRHDLPWRRPKANGQLDPYEVMVSEIMLQQTQVGRVIPKFSEFIERFPDVHSLAGAPLGDVLRAWNGLGYNRRAKFLWEAARMIAEAQGGRLPREAAELQKLPGIGPNTAGAIVTYAYNQPAVFIETNVRTVFIHHFFADEQSDVTDKQLAALVAETLDAERPRDWYWALMDYGTHLKQQVGNVARASKHYTKQSSFQGSVRQVRGQIIRLLASQPRTKAELTTQIADPRLAVVLGTLLQEQLIQKQGSRYQLTA